MGKQGECQLYNDRCQEELYASAYSCGVGLAEGAKMKWMIAINDLGPQQARILEDVTTDLSHTHWVAGYAGTGVDFPVKATTAN